MDRVCGGFLRGFPPKRDFGALRVLLFDVEKSLLRLFVPERMQQRDTLFECLLRIRSAPHGKMHRAQLFLRELFVMMAFVGRRGRGRMPQQYTEPRLVCAWSTPVGVS
jgi:hypothetical protein